MPHTWGNLENQISAKILSIYLIAKSGSTYMNYPIFQFSKHRHFSQRSCGYCQICAICATYGTSERNTNGYTEMI